MNTASPTVDERARKIASALFRRLASVGQATVAQQLGVSESTVSRMKSEGDIERFAKLVALCGMKTVPQDMRCYPPDQVDWLLAGNRIAAQRIKSAADLDEDEPE